MRKTAMAMTAAALLAMPAMAQFPGMMGGGNQGGDNLLANKSVQEELKMSEKQKDALKALQDKAQEEGKKAFEAFKDGDAEKGQEIFANVAKERVKGLKKIREGLDEKQAKRFKEISVQVAIKNSSPEIFQDEEIQKDLKLTAAQKKSAKKAFEEYEADLKEITDDLKSDFSKFKESFKKISDLRKGAFSKIAKSLDADQKATWKEMGGKEFELKNDNPFGKGKGKFGKKKDE